MPANFELKRYKPKLDIVEKPENRVHELTDSNGALYAARAEIATRVKVGKIYVILCILSDCPCNGFFWIITVFRRASF